MLTALLRVAGPSFFPIALASRLPFAMSIVGVMTAVSLTRDSYAAAGATAALVGVGSALIGPLVGMLADRYGQRPVLLAAGLVNGTALLALVAVLLREAPDGWLLAAGFLIGASSPQISPMVRVRWLNMIAARVEPDRRPRATQAALSYESMADELVFVFGPVLVGALASLLLPTAPLIAAAVLTIGCVTAFALHSTHEFGPARAPGARGAGDLAPLRSLWRPVCVLPVLGMGAVGLFFGSTLTSLTAFMGAVADGAQTGLAYGAMGLTSAVMALAVVLLPPGFALRHRWLVFALVALAGAVLLPLAATVPAMVAVLLVTGCGIGPVLVTLFGLAAQSAPAGRVTTLMAAMASAVIVGQSGASAVAGVVVEARGHEAGFLLVIGATALLSLLALAHTGLAQPASPRRRG
ncbi:MFS transporter [Sediminivirga luteola]|uniref:MFS transporter n=1 Tax=Sediminivirga luteola TaxID=1774748 RepID=A0A8J2TVW6_9MICO|nr:MFS transporter [Sediminivirga luteola]MCI2264403.1 MFS transporter [Sediminivirga luteola]GGA05935.1 MFS transporter [Sediminivirga luteola]